MGREIGFVAQLAEQSSFKRWVGGSSPPGSTYWGEALWRSGWKLTLQDEGSTPSPPTTAMMVESVDTQDLKSCAFGRGGSSPPHGTHKK